MMTLRALALLFALLAFAAPAAAQNRTCPTAPNGDSSNKCASTQFVQNAFASGLPLANSFIYVGNASNLAAQVAMGGDCTIANTGIVTCTKTSGAPFAPSATTDTTNASNISTGTLPPARLPAPTASTLGGVQSLTCASSNWFSSLSTGGVFGCTRPNFSDLAGQLAAATQISGQVPIANGGTNATTAAGARLNLNVESVTTITNASYGAVVADRVIATTATNFTAQRTVTLAAIASYNPGQSVVVIDSGGAINGANTLVIAANGSDTINGAASITISSQYSGAVLWPIGANKWGYIAAGSAAVNSFNGRTGSVVPVAGDYPVSLGGTGVTNLLGFVQGLQPLALSGSIIGVNPGTWANNIGTATFNSTVAFGADLTTSSINFSGVAPCGGCSTVVGGMVSGSDSSNSTLALSATSNITDGTEVFLYLVHRIGDGKVALIGDSSDIQGPFSLTFTATAASPGVITTSAAHGLRKRMTVYFSNSGGALPAPLGTNQQYFVCTVPSSTTFTVATSIANATSSTCLTFTTTGSGTNTATWGTQKDIDFHLGAGVVAFDRRVPWFAFVWSFTKYGCVGLSCTPTSGGIPNFTVPENGTRTVLTSMTEDSKYCTGAISTAGGAFQTVSLNPWLANINRQVLLHLFCSGAAGTCAVRTTGGGGNESTGQSDGTHFTVVNTEILTDSTNEIDVQTSTGTTTINACVKGWTQMDPSWLVIPLPAFARRRRRPANNNRSMVDAGTRRLPDQVA